MKGAKGGFAEGNVIVCVCVRSCALMNKTPLERDAAVFAGRALLNIYACVRVRLCAFMHIFVSVCIILCTCVLLSKCV